ncbi:MAG: response regulator [Alphaproteobacteria bacterium]|nr:response regulator [Alphaproteobacteria bacterium]
MSPEKKSLRLEAPHGGRPRLLLAEDCDPVRIVTAAMLKGMGCDVEAVIHGEDAVKSASENEFDVIVLDIEMPIMDGITAARSIRQMGGPIAATPLMALSAFFPRRLGAHRRMARHLRHRIAQARQPQRVARGGQGGTRTHPRRRLKNERAGMTRPLPSSS